MNILLWILAVFAVQCVTRWMVLLPVWVTVIARCVEGFMERRSPPTQQKAPRIFVG